MLRNKALPTETREFPPYVYREFPKMLGNVGSKDEPVWIVAESEGHEQALRDKYPQLPPFVPPPSSLTPADMRAIQDELANLRAENARLKAEKSGDVVADIKLDGTLPRAPRPAQSVPSHMPANSTQAKIDAELAKLASNEHPAGDPWADQPENAQPEGKPPSIKDRGRAPPAKTGRL